MSRPHSRLSRRPARRRREHSRAARSLGPLSPVGVEGLESRALLAVTANLVDGALRIAYSGSSDLATLSSSAGSYSVTGSGMMPATFLKSAVKSIQVNDATVTPPGGFRQNQTLLIGGTAAVTHPISVRGVETTTLNTNIVNKQFTGDVSFEQRVLLPAGRSISITSSRGDVLFGSSVDGDALLTLDAPGRSIVFSGKVGSATPLAGLALKTAEAVAALGSITVVARGKPLFSGISIGNSVKGLSLESAGSSVRGFATGIEIVGGEELGGPVRTIRHFTISGNGVGIGFVPPAGRTFVKTGSGFHDWSIEGNTIADNASDGIRFSAGAATIADVGITNNAILRNKRDGIRIAGPVTSLLVSKNTLSGNGTGPVDAAIRASGPGTSSSTPAVLQIAGNTISAGSPVQGSPATGIAAHSIPGLMVTGNTVTGLARGISLGGFLGGLGLVVDGPAKTTVSDNTVSDSSDVGIELNSARAATLSGNSVSKCSIGVLAAGICTASSMTDTKLEGNDEGVRLSGASGITLKNLVAHANGSGVRLIGAQGVTIQQASVTASKTVGLAVTGVCTKSVVIGGTFGGPTGISLTAARNLSLGDGWNVPGGGTTGLMATGDCSGTNLKGGTITGAAGNGVDLVAARSLLLTGLTVTLNAGFGLKASGDSSGTQILGGTYQSSDVGIGLAAAKNLTVSGETTIAANTKAGVSASGDCSGSVVSDCTINSNQTGVFLDAATGLGLIACHVNDSVSSGMQVKGSGKGSIFQAGSIATSGGNGVLLSSATDFRIYGSTIDDSGQSGIYAEGNCTGGVHNGNTIKNSGTFGVSLSAAKGISFKGTTVSTSGSHGLLAIGDCAGTKLDGSTFQGNGQVGAVLNAAKGLSLSNCLSKENKAHGFQAYGACTGSTVVGSTFTANKLAGFVLSGVQDLIANAGNTIEANTGNGLYADNLCTGTKIGGNTISKNGNAGVFLSAAKGISVINNTVTNNAAFGLNASGLSTGTTVLGNTFSGSPKNISVTATGGTFQQA